MPAPLHFLHFPRPLALPFLPYVQTCSVTIPGDEPGQRAEAHSSSDSLLPCSMWSLSLEAGILHSSS